jgi:hypothetical protein
VEALAHLEAEVAQLLELVLVLDALGDDPHPVRALR